MTHAKTASITAVMGYAYFKMSRFTSARLNDWRHAIGAIENGGTGQIRVTQISSPNNSALVIGRVFVASDGDQPTAFALAQQIKLAPLNQ